jgi:hypothetical protein
MKIGSTIYHSKRKAVKNAETQAFELPVSYTIRPNYLTIMPASSGGYTEIARYGEKIDNYWLLICNERCFANKFGVGDIFYIDGAFPIVDIEEKYGYGASGNAVVKVVATDNLCTRITLERNQGQKK